MSFLRICKWLRVKRIQNVNPSWNIAALSIFLFPKEENNHLFERTYTSNVMSIENSLSSYTQAITEQPWLFKKWGY